jgi:FAD/FMN-containing dehydrogenase/Fe-S oxidoreductase
MSTIEPYGLEEALRERVRGEVFLDTATRGMYATDASIYQIMPLAVCTPLDEDDVRVAVAVAAELGVPIVPRGGGTGLGGQCVGAGIVLDLSRHLDRVLEIDPERRIARVQPGVIRDELNRQLAAHGLFFSPETSTSNRANLGGMIANNSSGMRSVVHGKTLDHLRSLRVLLADGTEITCGPMTVAAARKRSEDDDREGRIHRGMLGIIGRHATEIRARYPKVMRRVAGYNLDAFLGADEWNLARIVCGSEGTLGVILEATLSLDPIPRARSLAVVHYRALLDAVAAVPDILGHQPSAVEVADAEFIRLARAHPTISPLLTFIDGEPGGIHLVEFYGDSAVHAEERARAFGAAMNADPRVLSCPVITDPAEQARVWSVRTDGLAVMLSRKGDRKPIPFIEDAAIPVAHLAAYVERIQGLCRRLGVDVAMYAHASVGVIHIRPMLDLKEIADIQRMVTIADEVLDLVHEYGGSWSGEHGDGLVRSGHLRRYFGDEVYRALREVKRLFDPAGLLNPGKIVDAEPMDVNLRYGPDYEVTPPPLLAFRYAREGGFTALVEACNGVGACRKVRGGTMCPSYRATRDERHSTRGRANALRMAMTGHLGEEGYDDPSLHAALELCLSCKACKTECPSNVDMARLKAELLQHRHDVRGPSMGERLAAALPVLAAKGSGALAPAANLVQRSGPARALLARIADVDRRRSLPPFTAQRFSQWVRRRGKGFVSPRRVALFQDCFLEHYEPEIGVGAVRVLEALGYSVEHVSPGCCQRTRISNGFLRDAAEEGRGTLAYLDPLLQDGVEVAVCEPSCISALTDDLPDLIDDPGLMRRVTDLVHPLEWIVARELREVGDAARLPGGPIRARFPRAIVHGHCHQKALHGMADLRTILAAVPGLETTFLDSGCCGMAGAFGYHHYDLAHRIGEETLFPAIRHRIANTSVVATGFSCRHQIRDATGVEALHWVQLLDLDG